MTSRLIVLSSSIATALLAVVITMMLSEPTRAGAATLTAKTCGGGTIYVKQAEKNMLAHHNRERAERSKPRLCFARQLQRAARKHSEDMIERDYFSHRTKGSGETFIDRIKAEGYEHSTAAENIAYGSGPRGYSRNIMQDWMRSSGHKANILDGSLRQVGIAVNRGGFKGTPNTRMWVADYGTPQGSAQDIRDGSFKVNVLSRGLELPWDLTFLPNGDGLITERDTGRLLRVTPSGEVSEVRTLSAKSSREGGLLGVALHPDFKENRFVYVYYSTREDNRVARFRLGGAFDDLEPIVTGIPVSFKHNGGRIAFGPDGMLYIATGDAAEAERSQDKRSLGGKILRVDPEGSIPGSNPFDNEIWTLGHRNVQGLAWDEVGRMYATEFGKNTYDEVNRIRKGSNYGWPEVEGRESDPRYRNPITTFRPENASPSGAAIYKKTSIERWNGSLIVAALRGERLWKINLDDQGEVTNKIPLLRGEYGRLRHVAVAPGGDVWVLTSNGTDDRILRVSPDMS